MPLTARKSAANWEGRKVCIYFVLVKEETLTVIYIVMSAKPMNARVYPSFDP